MRLKVVIYRPSPTGGETTVRVHSHCYRTTTTTAARTANISYAKLLQYNVWLFDIGHIGIKPWTRRCHQRIRLFHEQPGTQTKLTLGQTSSSGRFPMPAETCPSIRRLNNQPAPALRGAKNIDRLVFSCPLAIDFVWSVDIIWISLSLFSMSFALLITLRFVLTIHLVFSYYDVWLNNIDCFQWLRNKRWGPPFFVSRLQWAFIHAVHPFHACCPKLFLHVFGHPYDKTYLCEYTHVVDPG